MRRTLLILTVAVLMVAMVATSAVPASAQAGADRDEVIFPGAEFPICIDDLDDRECRGPFFPAPEFGIDAVGPENKAADVRGFVIFKRSK
jgi:hypothetical protein